MSPVLASRISSPSAPRRAGAEIRAALVFLTRVPIATTDELTGAPAFALIGAAIGLPAAVLVLTVGPVAPLAAAALATAMIAVLTGGLHLDGLGDTFDALAASDPEAAEHARLDPRLGSGGVAAVVIVLILDVALLGELVARAGGLAAGLTCVAAVAASRGILVLTGAAHRHRARAGSARWFVARLSPHAVTLTVLGTVLITGATAALASTPAIIIGSAGGSLIGLLAGAWLVRSRGGLDGDALGATTELSTTAILLVTLVVA